MGFGRGRGGVGCFVVEFSCEDLEMTAGEKEKNGKIQKVESFFLDFGGESVETQRRDEASV